MIEDGVSLTPNPGVRKMSNDELNYDDPEVVQNWINDQKKCVLDFLREEGASHGGVPDEPDYCVAPHVAVWRVFNPNNVNSIGFWVISGDLPTDYVSSDDAHDVREVLGHFGRLWKEVAEYMTAGKKHPTVTIGPPEKWQELAPLLEERAEILCSLAENDECWEEEDEEIV
jgi:hypothetical protein